MRSSADRTRGIQRKFYDMRTFALLALVAAAVSAQEDDDIMAEMKREAEASEGDDHDSATTEDAPDYDPEHPLTDMPESAPTMEVSSAFFVGHADKTFPIGTVVDVMFTMTNNGDGPFNVTAAMGSLNNVDDFPLYYRNFTRKNFNTVIAAQSTEEGKKKINEYTFVYSFELSDKYADAKQYLSALTVFYETEAETFSTTFFNSTITLVNGDASFDAASLTFLATILIGAFGVWVVLNKVLGGKKGKRSGSSSTEQGTAAATPLKEKATEGRQVAKKRKKKKSSKKSTKKQ